MKNLRFLALAIVVYGLACSQGSATMPNPLVRLDLSSQLPKKVRGRLPSAIYLDCHEKVTLASEGAKQEFVVNWRIADVDGKRYMMAVDVQPSGKTQGASASKASGTIGKLQRKDVDTIPIFISWQAQKGCSSIEQVKRLEIRSDHASCKSDQPAGLLKKGK